VKGFIPALRQAQGDRLLYPTSLSQRSLESAMRALKRIRFSVYLDMTKSAIHIEIDKVLDSIPENVLPDVLKFLKELQKTPAEKVILSGNLRQILTEDKELLERLAQ
jgi:hypothetical protein